MRPRIKKALANSIDLPFDNIQAVEDAHVYSSMTEDGLNNLPAFWPDGTVRFYECGGVLLGRSALIQFIKQLKTR